MAEFDYRPTACRQELPHGGGPQEHLGGEGRAACCSTTIRYFFYITNDWVSEADEVVFAANDRCNQENLLAQLKGGVRALTAPVDNLVSNWAYMVMTALAWNLKAWWALAAAGERRAAGSRRHRAEKQWVLGMEFKTFVNAFVRLPCQIVRTGRQLVYRLLAWNPYQPIFFRLVDVLRC